VQHEARAARVARGAECRRNADERGENAADVHHEHHRIAELDPDDVLAHTSLSVLYQKKGMIPEAEGEANKARILGWKQQLKKGGL
jgi:Tfp pilus assembly protein PilF